MAHASFQRNMVFGDQPPAQDPSFREPPMRISGDADRYNHREGNDDYKQPGDLFRLLSPDSREQLMANVRDAMQGVPMDIVLHQVEHFYRADPAYGIGVATRMGLGAVDMPWRRRRGRRLAGVEPA